MSRVGRLPITIPADIIVAVSADNVVSVKGPKSKFVEAMNKDMNIAVENNQVVVTRPSDREGHKALRGLTRALINSVITGVKKGFEKGLELIGVGHRAQLQSKKLVMNSGYSHPVEIESIEGVTFETPAATKAVVKGADKERVGAAAADIKSWREPKPYRGKGTKYGNEITRCKEGKAGKK